MKSRFRLGIQVFIRDMRESVSLTITFAIAVAAFVLAFAVATGFSLP
jgi:hypothetical protein